jgi:general secretion pathway protein A
MYVIAEGKGAGMLTGEYGSGKTVLARLLTTQLDGSKYKFAYITNPQMSGIELIREIIRQIGVVEDFPNMKSDLLHTLTEILKRNAEIGRTTAVIIDDAQLIKDTETLEEIRLLLTLQTHQKFLLNVILVGQTELREKINRIPQLKGRLAMSYHLNPLNERETGEYILHRLKVSGRTEPLFTDLAIKAVYEYSQGLPREINNICDLSLLIGFSHKSDTINRDILKIAISELRGQS